MTTTILDKFTKTIESLSLEKLRIDENYQSKISMAHAKKIALNFNLLGLGLIHVNRRNDGFYYIIDGQHRTKAMEIRSVKFMDCIVYEGMTIKDEATAYRFLNTTKVKKPMDIAGAKFEAGETNTLHIVSILDNYGLKVDFKNPEKGHIKAWATIEKIYYSDGPKMLNDVITILYNSFGREKDAYQTFVLQGLYLFMKDYEGKYKEDWLIKNFKKFGLKTLLLQALAYQKTFNSNKYKATKEAMVYYHDHNKASHNKLRNM